MDFSDRSKDLAYVKRLENELEKARKKNGKIFCALEESAPERIGPDGTILPLERVEAARERVATGMRRSANPCTGCGEHWSEPSRRGRMNRICTTCREGDTN